MHRGVARTKRFEFATASFEDSRSGLWEWYLSCRLSYIRNFRASEGFSLSLSARISHQRRNAVGETSWRDPPLRVASISSP